MTKHRKPFTLLYLITAFLAVSAFVNATPLPFNQQLSNSNNKIFSDSLKQNIALSGTDSLPLHNMDSVKLANDSAHMADTSLAFIHDTIHKTDTIDKVEESEIQDIINYKATDSIVYDMDTKKNVSV